LHERLRTISLPNAEETELFWAFDSKRLGFVATIKGQKGLYAVSFPAPGSPTLIVGEEGTHARWISMGNQIVWLSNGRPASVSVSSNKQTSYGLLVRTAVNVGAKYRAAFDQCWRIMRDHWYDQRLGNRNWDEVGRKYRDAAGRATDDLTFSTIVAMMLGELNGSHLGFSPSGSTDDSSTDAWHPSTAHLGVRFDANHQGPGLKIRDVLPRGPAEAERSRLRPGETILSIDGAIVDPAADTASLLNGSLPRDVRLRVAAVDGKERDVVLRPIPYEVAGRLLYEQWVRDTRKRVEDASQGKLGYVHIAGMDQVSLFRFEEELFSAASGKSGLVIDVRENGGGFTTDHLLTMLTQPTHAITVPRGGTPGYPQDRRVYAVWNKPIVVLCNQNSFSNAEIFSHAIKTLKRGKLIGVPTAGGVVSTGAVSIMDVGTLRLPTRGWFLPDTGQDMELNGAVPDVLLWPHPGDMPQGKDEQLNEAVRVLQEDVKQWEQRPLPKLIKATERN
jgi:tricorn protease